MSILNVISLLGGIALFLFGMSLMGDGLKQAAGNKMELVLYKISSTTLKSILLGTAVTAVIQSSGATSAMVVGFVNSSMMALKQAMGVILGSLLGTSITGWVIALPELGASESGLTSLLSTATITGVVAVIGIIMHMTAKNQTRKHVSSILLGFAVLMYGMSSMSSAVAPLKQSQAFINLMMSFSNPFLGLLIGIVVTAILQSASSAVGLLQALSATGVIDFEIAFPILLGINIGASVPVLLSAIGAKTDAKRAAGSYLIMSVAGSVVVGAIFYGINAIVNFSFMTRILNTVSIAFVNSAFRFAMVLVEIPLLGILEKLLVKMIPSRDSEIESIVPPLEERLLANPAIAIQHAHDTTVSMVQIVGKNINNAISLLTSFDKATYQSVLEREDVVDRYEDKLGAYLVKITQQEISNSQSKAIAEYLHAISDLERISDHAQNIAENGQEIFEKGIRFSQDGDRELSVLYAALSEVVGMAFDSFIHDDVELAYRVEPLEDIIDEICDEMKSHHVERISKGECTIGYGYAYNDILTNVERVSDHCSNIALAVIEAYSEKFDAHEYITNLEENRTELFKKYFEMYSEKYSLEKK